MVVASTPSTTLVVNPAFLQEIKESNPDLERILLNLRRLLVGSGRDREVCNKLTRCLDDLREQLSLQFSLEESYGYLAVGTSEHGPLSDVASHAQSQHGMLYMQLSDLAEQAEELQYRGVESEQLDALLEGTRAFDANLRDHEREELELIRQAYESR